MFKRLFLLVIILIIGTASFFIGVKSLNAALETQLPVDVSPASGNVPYGQTQWYGFNAAAGKGYCVIISPSTGNSDLYLFDSYFSLRTASKNTGTAIEKFWYGQSASGTFHIASYGVGNPSSNYTVQVITAPYVATATPSSGASGVLVTLNGFGFADVRGTSYVKFGTVTATNYSLWTNRQIKVYVPSGVPSGNIQIVVYVASKASNPKTFTSQGALSSDGSMWRYDLGRTGNYPNGPTSLPLSLKWSYPLGAGSSAPTVANNILYVGSDKLYALDASTGILKWSYSATYYDGGYSYRDYFWGWPPAVAGNIVYMGSSSGRLYALDANTGSLKWVYYAPQQPPGYAYIKSSPTVFNNVVYCNVARDQANGDMIYALDANTGVLKWSYSVGVKITIIGSLAASNNTLYFGTYPGPSKLYALDASTGSVKWTYIMVNQTTTGTPTVVNGVVYIAAMDHTAGSKIFALDASIGSLKWQTGSLSWFYNLAITNGLIYASSINRYGLSVFDANTGAYKWGWFGASGDASSAPSVSNGLVYLGNGATLYILDAYTGSLKWSYLLENGVSGVEQSPIIYGGKVYIRTDDNGGVSKVYCFG